MKSLKILDQECPLHNCLYFQVCKDQIGRCNWLDEELRDFFVKVEATDVSLLPQQTSSK